MAVKLKTKPEQHYSVSKAYKYPSLTTDIDDGDTNVYGTVRTEHGICTAESSRHRFGQKGAYRWSDYTSLRFIHNGKEHSLYEERFRTERSLASLAYAFVKAIVNGERL